MFLIKLWPFIVTTSVLRNVFARAFGSGRTGDGWWWITDQEKGPVLMCSYFWLIVALYLASYESEGPENHIEKDRWKSLRWVSLLLIFVHIYRRSHFPWRRPHAFGRKSLSLNSKSCVSCLPLTEFLWLKTLIAIIQSYCLSFFKKILADVRGVSLFFFLSPIILWNEELKLPLGVVKTVIHCLCLKDKKFRLYFWIALNSI